MKGYNRLTYRRVSRRGVIRGSALGAAGATAFAIACGGDDDSGSGPSAEQRAAQVQEAVATRADSSAQAVPGGIYQHYRNADVTNLDPLTSTSFTAAVAGAWVYSRLLRYKAGAGAAPTGEVEGDLVERWEQPDPLRLVMKLRQDAVYDERPPTNKRGVDAEDVVFSWKRFAANGEARTNVVNSVSPSAPIESIEAQDKYTITVKLAFPFAPVGQMLAFSRHIQIMPREADGGFDPRNDMRGSGAWRLENYQRSVKFEWRKNPNWFIKDRPFLDGWDQPIIPEYAAQLAQFRAKRIWHFDGLRQEDVVATKTDLPELQLNQGDFTRSCWAIYFGIRPNSPFLDERVRRAVSMLIDRDQWIDTFYNVNEFKKQQYPTDVRWHSAISSGWEGYWVDPQSDDMGEGKANFQYNPAEAKKLLAAAGYPNGIQTDFAHITSSQYGAIYVQYAEAFKGMLEAHGDFKFRLVNPEYQTEFIPKYVNARGDFDGMYVAATTTHPDVDGALFAFYHKSGNVGHIAFKGQGGDERSFAMIESQRKELDAKKRVDIIKEWQRYTATKMPILSFPGQSRPYTLAWPWVGNWGAFREYHTETQQQETYTQAWFDKSKFTG